MYEKFMKTAAGVALSMGLVTSATAATLTLDPTGHTGQTLANFNPAPGSTYPNGAGELVDGTEVAVFESGVGGGLTLVLGAGEKVNIRYTYLAKEAGNSNGAYEAVAQGTQTLRTGGGTPSTPGVAFAVETDFNCGSSSAGTCFVPLTFTSITGDGFGSPIGSATNGGSMATDMSIAWWHSDMDFKDKVGGGRELKLDDAVLTSTTWYALYDDSGASNDDDWDDMLLEIVISSSSTTIPVPAPLLLLLSGLFGLGFLGRFRKSRDLATSS